jgi:hypothetical protein
MEFRYSYIPYILYTDGHLVYVGVQLLLLHYENAGLPLIAVLNRHLVKLGHLLLKCHPTSHNINL